MNLISRSLIVFGALLSMLGQFFGFNYYFPFIGGFLVIIGIFVR